LQVVEVEATARAGVRGGGDVHDASVFSRDELLAQRRREQEGSEVVHLERHLVAVDRLAARPEHEPRVVDEHVELPVRRGVPRGEVAHRRKLRQVELHHVDAGAPAALPDLGERSGALGGVAGREHDVGTGRRERDCRLLADPGVATGDEHRAPFHRPDHESAI
jgi:hypothetical protein